MRTIPFRCRWLILSLAGLSVIGAGPTEVLKHAGAATLYVSSAGDNSDGSSWARAFRTIQGALSSVPDPSGGHRIIVRPGTYLEANLEPRFRGAAGSYDLLIGDIDGRLGSGATGRVIIDSGDPSKGFKSYDWWGPIRAYSKGWSKEHTGETASSLSWDRWIFRNLYVTGGDAGLFFDLTDKTGSPFSVIVEDCVSIGRAFGGGVAGSACRPGEPVVYRRSYLLCLDWWGDAAGAYVRAHNPAMPGEPDAVFEDCTLAGPDNAVQVGYPTYTDIYSHLRFKNCRLISMNFSQPGGTPSSGILCCDIPGAHCQLDLEDSTLMGYKVFGISQGIGKRTDPVLYSIRGKVRAYVQFQQEVPKGFERLVQWPVETFDALLPMRPGAENRVAGRASQADQVARKAWPKCDGVDPRSLPGKVTSVSQPTGGRTRTRSRSDVPASSPMHRPGKSYPGSAAVIPWARPSSTAAGFTPSPRATRGQTGFTTSTISGPTT